MIKKLCVALIAVVMSIPITALAEGNPRVFFAPQSMNETNEIIVPIYTKNLLKDNDGLCGCEFRFAYNTEQFTLKTDESGRPILGTNETMLVNDTSMPENALDKAIVWSVTDKEGNPTDKVTINETGLFAAKDTASNGEYIVKALNAKSGTAGTAAVTVNIAPTEKYKINSYNTENGTVNITKQSTDSAWLIVATYTADGKLVKATIKDISGENTRGKDIELPNAFEGEYSEVKVFMWDSLKNMQPRCEALP